MFLLKISLLSLLPLLGTCSSPYPYSSSPLSLSLALLLENGGKDGRSPLPQRYSDGTSLREKLEKWTPDNLIGNVNPNMPIIIIVDNKEEFCTNGGKEGLIDAVERAINYYEAHVNLLDMVDAAVGLQVVEGMAEHVGLNGSLKMGWARTTPLLQQIGEQTIQRNKDTEVENKDLPGFLQPNHIFSHTASPFKGWKPFDKLAKIKTPYISVGNDPETIWADINAPCQLALATRCEVPHVCRKLFLDPQPQSQYMLSHQALYVYLGIQQSCQLQHPKVFRNWEVRMDGYCAKMLGEAEFIAAHNYPEWGRDIFAEYVFICGLAGYPNFLRSEWIGEILSWQSKSDYGCFLNPGMSKYSSTELTFPRYPTSSEKSAGIEETGESCLTHLSSVSLAALAVKLRWIHENC